jgi:uncharacterized membrane protein
MSYTAFLLFIHIGGAIIGLGPTFAFGVMGPMASREGGPAAMGLMQAMVAIEKRLVYPVFLVTQPLTGVLLIFDRGYNRAFFDHHWLVGAIVIYVVALYVAMFQSSPALARMIDLAQEGRAGSEEFEAHSRRPRVMGPILALMLVVIMFLMIVKPAF